MTSPISLQKVLKSRHIQAEFRVRGNRTDPSTHLLFGEDVAFCIDNAYLVETFHELAKGVFFITNYRIIFAGYYMKVRYKDIYKAGKTSMVSKAVKVITKSNTSFKPIDVVSMTTKLQSTNDGNSNIRDSLTMELKKQILTIEDVISIPLTSIDDLANVPLVHLIREKLSLESGVKIISRICHDIVICIPYDNIYSVDYLIKQLYIRMRSVPTGMTAIFAFRHFKKICTSKSGEKYIPVKDEFNSNIYSFEAETARIDITDDNNWDVINNNGSESYPIFAQNIIIPRTFHTSLLPELAKRYRGGRFPIVCWKEKDTNCFLLRSAYMIESRSNSIDKSAHLEDYYYHICNCLGKSTDIKLYIFSPRSSNQSVTNFLLARSRKDSDVNKQPSFVHVKSKAFQFSPAIIKRSLRLFLNLLSHEKDDKYLVQLDECRWLQMISMIIQKAVEMALIIAKCSASVIASFEDGQDFTAQVTSLTQLLLDPYYRTMDGFQVLIQKEWSEIGHPFCKRNLPFLRRDKEAEGPVFIQWLDCVYQIVTQFPYLFEFTPNFLHDIAYHVYSCRFGTFLSNDVFDEEKYNIYMRTVSFWDWMRDIGCYKPYRNRFYIKESYHRLILPLYSVPFLKIWKECYCNMNEIGSVNSNLGKLYQQYQTLITEYKELCNTLDIKFDKKLYIDAHLNNNERCLAELFQIKPIRKVMLKKNERNINLEYEEEDNPQSWKTAPNIDLHYSNESLTDSNGTPDNSLRRQTINFVYILQRKGLSFQWEHKVVVEKLRCSGYLTKLGKIRKNWKKRWFILDYAQQSLSYYSDISAQSSLKGCIDIHSMKSVCKEEEDHYKGIYIISLTTYDRTYRLKASNEIEMVIWITILECVIYNNNSASISAENFQNE
ncbi:Myotubularin [Trichoplax sp. H2]|nr:Myotubularin [Trichoplax sp. H2]|eukprot:RDD37655.1 Myotubularin [Trichoplax sp. H2]